MTATSRVLFLHGFASSPGGTKAVALRAALGQNGIEVIAADLNVPSFRYLDHEEMVRVSFDLASRHDPRVIIGSSLGALVALGVVARGVDRPLVLIAPALGSRKGWVERLPEGDPVMVYHHGEECELAIHRAFFLQMAALEIDDRPPEPPLTVFMGRRDEVLSYDRVRAVWDRWMSSGESREDSRFITIDEGDHRLIEHVDLIANEILLRCDGRSEGS